MKKDSFILYTQFAEVISELSDEQAGVLLKSIFAYVKTGTEPHFSGLQKIAWIPIRQQLDRTNEKWEKKSKINSQNGEKGGRPKKANGLNDNPTEKVELSNNPEKANGYFEKRTVILETEPEAKKPNGLFEKPNVLVNANVLVNDNELDNAVNSVNTLEEAAAAAISFQKEKIMEYWNSTCKNLPSVRELTFKRGAALQILLTKGYTSDEITDCMLLADQTPTLNGSKPIGGGTIFRATFDWVINESNFVTLYEQRMTAPRPTDAQKRLKLEEKRRQQEIEERKMRDSISNLKGKIYAEMKAEQGDGFEFDAYEIRCATEISQLKQAANVKI